MFQLLSMDQQSNFHSYRSMLEHQVLFVEKSVGNIHKHRRDTNKYSVVYLHRNRDPLSNHQVISMETWLEFGKEEWESLPDE